MFEWIGGMLGLAFYAAQAVALGGGFIMMLFGGENAGRAWLAWTLPTMIAIGLVLFFGMSLVGAAMAFWRLLTDMEYGSG